MKNVLSHVSVCDFTPISVAQTLRLLHLSILWHQILSVSIEQMFVNDLFLRFLENLQKKNGQILNFSCTGRFLNFAFIFKKSQQQSFAVFFIKDIEQELNVESTSFLTIEIESKPRALSIVRAFWHELDILAYYMYWVFNNTE